MSTSKPKKSSPKKAEISSESEKPDFDEPSKTQRQSSFTVHHHALQINFLFLF